MAYFCQANRDLHSQIMRPALLLIHMFFSVLYLCRQKNKYIHYLVVGFVFITLVNDMRNAEVDWCYQHSSCKFIC